MTASLARYDSAVEERVLEELRGRYERRGYTFVAHPEPALLPAFMAGYVPDAVATSDRDNIAIEVKGNPSIGGTESVERLRTMFVGHDDWKFTVVYGGIDPQRAIQIPLAHDDAFHHELRSIEQLLKAGQSNAAMVMAFALLEAVTQSMGIDDDRRPQRPGTVVQTLAMNGFIDSRQEKMLRDLIAQRNRIVHGDLSTKVGPAEVQILIDTLKGLLTLKAEK